MNKSTSLLAKGGVFQSIPCKIRCTCEIDVFAAYRPVVGQVYEAVFSPGFKKQDKRNGKIKYSGKGDFCIVEIRGKKIVLRKGEYEFVEVPDGEY